MRKNSENNAPRRKSSVVQVPATDAPIYSHDILKPDLDVIFCGQNPATSAVSDGHNFSNASNRFWRTLHLTGFTKTLIDAREERTLLAFKCGVTAAVSRATNIGSEISPTEFRDARQNLEAKIRRLAPRCIAFLGKQAICAMMDEKLPWGRQSFRFAGTLTWILPNPSGRNLSFSLHQLVESYSALRIALETE